MSKQKHRQRVAGRKEPEPGFQPATTESGSKQPLRWSSSKRTIASLLLLAYLGVVLIGPLSNPISSAYFSAPLARNVAPIHRMLFLGHGYRFFAPDPGASHRLVYRGLRADGKEFNGHFPDRDSHWPRLLYHRWFMLSETLFNENLIRPTATQIEERNQEYDREIERYRAAGKTTLCEQLSRERDAETLAQQRADMRVEILASRIAQVLLDRNDGQSIELFLQEREIPFPEQVSSGMRLDNDFFLSELLKIGELDADGFRVAAPGIAPGEESPQ